MGRGKQIRQLNKYAVVAVVAVILLVAGAGYVLLSGGDDQAEVAGATTVVYEDPSTGLSANYSDQLVLDTSASGEGFIFAISSEDPSLSVVAQYEEGDSLRKLKTLGTDVRATIAENVKRQLPSQYQDIEILEELYYDLNGFRAAELVFTYTKPDGQQATQRLLILLKNDETAVYVSAQAQTDDFDSVNEQYLEPILSSLTF